MINPIFKTPTTVLFAFSPEVVETIKQSDFTVWEVANDIFNNVSEVIIRQSLSINEIMNRPVIDTNIQSFTLGGGKMGDVISHVKLKEVERPIAFINPYIGLSLGILADYEKN